MNSDLQQVYPQISRRSGVVVAVTKHGRYRDGTVTRWRLRANQIYQCRDQSVPE